MARRRIALIIAVWLLPCAVEASPRPAHTPAADVLLDAMLAAESAAPLGAPPSRAAIESAASSVVDEVGPGRPTYRRGRHLHRVLHERLFRRYDDEADGLGRMLDEGRYNCLSATLFEALVADRLGFSPEVLELPGHLLLRIRLAGGETIDVETTSPEGFDLGKRVAAALDNPFSPRMRSVTRYRAAVAAARVEAVPLERAGGFAWLNAAWRELDRGRAAEAAHAVERGHELLPEAIARSEGVRRLLVRAFNTAYEAGRFEEAYRVARTDRALSPSSTTALDRLLASAWKRIEAACAADRPALGEQILDDMAREAVRPGERERLERRSWPMIATTAVRTGDWELARRAAERYLATEPDATEASRLLRWIELRRHGLPDDGCADPLFGASFLLGLD